MAGFQRPWESVLFSASSGSTHLGDMPFSWPSATDGIRVRLDIDIPQDANDVMFHRALDLVGDDDFRQARRRLWSWESQLPDNPSANQLLACLTALPDDYNRVVKRHVKNTRKAAMFVLVPAAVGLGLDLFLGGGLVGSLVGAGSGVAIEGVKARFPTLTGDALRASHHHGSAVAGMLSVLGPA